MSISQTKLIALINATNTPPVPVTLQNAELVSPVPSFGSSWNTRVTLRAIPGAGFKSEVNVYYRRIPLDLIDAPITVERGSIVTPQEALDAINALYNTWLELEELEAFVVPPLVAGQDTFLTLRALPGSLSWLNEVNVVLRVVTVADPAVSITDASFALNYPLITASVTGTLVANP